MRFFTSLVAAIVVFSAGTHATADVYQTLAGPLGELLTPANHYGAPIPPWESGANPGWYYGSDANIGQEFVWLLDSIICFILDLIPGCLHCPPPNPPPQNGWDQTFYNLTGATQASDYMTYGLVDTIADCETMCLNVEGCVFVNSYHDVNGKGGSTQLTCSLFTQCHNATDADNFGGQTQPDGSVDFITNSNGFCHE